MTDSLESILRKIIREELRAELDARAQPAPTQITAAAYAQLHGISLTTVRAAIRDGRLPAERFGRAVRVPAAAKIGKPVRAATPSSPASTSALADRVLSVMPGGRR